MATNLVIPQLVSEEARMAREQQQRQALGQIISLGQAAASARARQEVDEDRDFRAMMTIAADANFPDDMRVAAINRLAPKLNLPGTITIEGLKPMTALLDKMWKTQMGGGDLTVYQPAIDMITQNPRLIQPSQLPQAVELAQAVRGQRATGVAEGISPMPPEVQEATERAEARAPELIQLRNQRQDLEAKLQGAMPVSLSDRQSSFGKLERLDALEQEDRRDAAVRETDLMRRNRNRAISKLAQNNPKLLEQGEAYALAKGGFSPFDADGLKMRLHELQSQETLTDEDTRQLDSLSRIVLGKSVIGQFSQTNARLLDLRMQQAKAEVADLTKAKDAYAAAMTAAQPYRTMLETVVAGGQSATSPEAVADVSTLTANTSQAMGQAKLDALTANQPQIEALTEDRVALEQKATALRQQAVRAPSSQRATMLDREHSMRRQIEARDAQVDLMTTYHPLEGVEHEWNQRLQEEHVKELEAQLKKDNPSDVRTRLEQELDDSRAIVTSETKALDEWKTGRQRALVNLEKGRLGLERDSAALQMKLTNVQMSAQKEEATNLLASAVLTDITRVDPELKRPKTVTEAVRDNKGQFPLAETKDVVKIVEDARKVDDATALAYAQDIFAVSLAGLKEPLSADVAAKLAQKAVAAARKQYGFTPKVDDVLKALPTTSQVGGEGLTDVKRQQDMFNSVIQTAARLTGEQVGGINISQGPSGESQIQIGGQIKDPVKLGAEILQQVDVQTYLPRTVLEPLRRLGQRLSASKAVEPTGPTPPTSPPPLNPVEDFRKELGLQ